MSETSKLGAAVETLAENLRHIDARLTLSAALQPERLPTLETALRAMQFRARIRQTLKELEIKKCK